MNRIISRASEGFYKWLAKPILFRFQPDAVHNGLIKTGKIVQSVPPLRGLIHWAWAHEDKKFLEQQLLGITFTNPVGLSAGFDKNFELAPLLKSVGFGYMEGGSLTYHQCDGNPRPWFYRLPKTKSLVVYAGLANQGSEAVIQRIAGYPRHAFQNFPLNISVAKTNSKESCTDEGAVNDYVGSVRAIKETGVGAVVTLNISCPNTYGGEPFNTPERLEMLLTAIDAVELDQPLFIKMPSDLPWDRFRKLLEVASQHNVQGLTISNLAKDRSKIALKDPLPDSVKGNLSGKPVWELSNELIRQTYLAYGDRFVIIGVGGIFSAQDAYTKIKLGANMVELITGMIFEGPQLIGQINAGLVALLKKDGHTNIAQARGVDAGM